MEIILNWFNRLSKTQKILFFSVVVTFVGSIIIPFIVGGKNTIIKEDKNIQTVTHNFGVMIQGDDSTVEIHPDSPETKRKLDVIVELLKQQGKLDVIVELLKQQALNTPPSSQEEASIRQQIENLLLSTNKQKQEASKQLEKGNILEAIDILKTLDKEQSQHLAKQKQQAVDTKLQLSALLSYTDPETAKQLLAEVVKLEPHHPVGLNRYGLLLMRMGEVEKAVEVFETLLLSEEKSLKGVALGNLGVAYADLGEVERAIEYYEQALKISRDIQDRQGEGGALGNLGVAYADLGEVERAIEYHEQALSIHREVKNRQGEGNAFVNLGGAYHRLGEVERAIEYHEQALKISRDIQDRQGEGGALGNLGVAYADLGEVERAIEYFEQALSIHRDIKNRQGEGKYPRQSGFGLSFRRGRASH